MKKILLLLLIISGALFSCNNSTHADVDTSVPQVREGNTAFTAPEPADSDSTGSIPTAPAEAYQAANLNPPHGEPGHDCAIAVGAPLNKAARTVTPAAAPANQPAKTGKLNPPHGQPGHRCEIPVGQPLP